MFDIGVWRTATDGSVEETVAGDELRGMPKLVQRVFIALLQESNTVKYSFGKRRSSGCGFVTALRSGNIRNEMDVSAQFCLARHFIFEDLQSDEVPEDPPEECFKDVRYKGIIIAPGLIKLKLNIQSRTATVTVLLPISMPM